MNQLQDKADPEAAKDALWLAMTMGRRILFDGEENLFLEVPVAIAASRRLAEYAEEMSELYKNLEERALRDEYIGREEEASDVLGVRMQVWAALISILDTYEAVMENGKETTKTLRKVTDEMVQAVGKLDDALQAQKTFLSASSRTNVLKNWRAMLVEPYNISPWWLDGCLEGGRPQQ